LAASIRGIQVGRGTSRAGLSVIKLPHILVAEDSRPAREHLVKTLDVLGNVRVSEAQNGAEAISMVERLGPDLLLCDYNMPILDGLQTLKLLRRKWSAVELPILMLTGSHSVNDKVAAFNFGANDYVTKPVHPEELLARVKAQLSLKLAISQNQAARDRLLQASKLQTVGRLAAGLAHEMNTPAQFVSDNLHFLTKAFAGMQATLESLRPAVSGESAPTESGLGDARQSWRKHRVAFALEQAPAALSQSLEGVRRIADLIAELKAFSGTGAEDTRVASNVNDAIANVVNVSRGEWESVAEVLLQLDTELPPVPVYVAELKQVMLNLVYNCVHAFRGDFGGEARRGKIEIASRRQADGVEVSISDDGPGIPLAIRDLVFDPFFTTKEVGGGMGQGLAVAYDVIVNRHGGKLTCLESESSGARFEIWLPLAPADGPVA
jgi:signal transduction histidine kinase